MTTSVAQAIRELVESKPGLRLVITSSGADGGMDFSVESESGVELEDAWISSFEPDGVLAGSVEQMACNMIEALERQDREK